MTSPDPAAFKAWLRARALGRGFARVGFCACGPLEEERERLLRWFAEGRGALLPYLEADAMLDPQRVLEGARTALVGFLPYARPEAQPGAAPGSLRLSRYLWGPDYHTILKGRLIRLLEEAQARWPGLQGRACVDTAPLMERALAERAGLGWRGRNTLLIAGKAGSYGFLGVLLLDAVLEPDPPFGDHRCGTCTRCLDACPAGALEPFRLDPARCLTTYTVESEAEPPETVLRALKATRWAAGCDLCQEACPWNRAPLWGDPELWGGPSPVHQRSGVELRALGAAQWRRLTRGSALRRVRLRHWQATLGRILGREGEGGLEEARGPGEDPREP